MLLHTRTTTTTDRRLGYNLKKPWWVGGWSNPCYGVNVWVIVQASGLEDQGKSLSRPQSQSALIYMVMFRSETNKLQKKKIKNKKNPVADSMFLCISLSLSLSLWAINFKFSMLSKMPIYQISIFFFFFLYLFLFKFLFYFTIQGGYGQIL